MTLIKAVEPKEWETYLSSFTGRNAGRRARFEIFNHGNVSEESQEGTFESISITGNTVTVKRRYQGHGEERSMIDELKNIHGISVQYDTDNSEDMLEFTDDRNQLTTLHFESRVDGD